MQLRSFWSSPSRLLCLVAPPSLNQNKRSDQNLKTLAPAWNGLDGIQSDSERSNQNHDPFRQLVTAVRMSSALKPILLPATFSSLIRKAILLKTLQPMIFSSLKTAKPNGWS